MLAGDLNATDQNSAYSMVASQLRDALDDLADELEDKRHHHHHHW